MYIYTSTIPYLQIYFSENAAPLRTQVKKMENVWIIILNEEIFQENKHLCDTSYDWSGVGVTKPISAIQLFDFSPFWKHWFPVEYHV